MEDLFPSSQRAASDLVFQFLKSDNFVMFWPGFSPRHKLIWIWWESSREKFGKLRLGRVRSVVNIEIGGKEISGLFLTWLITAELWWVYNIMLTQSHWCILIRNSAGGCNQICTSITDTQLGTRQPCIIYSVSLRPTILWWQTEGRGHMGTEIIREIINIISILGVGCWRGDQQQDKIQLCWERWWRLGQVPDQQGHRGGHLHRQLPRPGRRLLPAGGQGDRQGRPGTVRNQDFAGELWGDRGDWGDWGV